MQALPYSRSTKRLTMEYVFAKAVLRNLESCPWHEVWVASALAVRLKAGAWFCSCACEVQQRYS